MWKRLKRLMKPRRARNPDSRRAELADLAVQCLRRRPDRWRPREMRDWLT